MAPDMYDSQYDYSGYPPSYDQRPIRQFTPYNYPSAPYPAWPSDTWAHYNQSFIPDVPFNSGPGRPDPLPADQRPYPPPPQEPRRSDDRPVVAGTAKPRRKDRDSPPTAGLPASPPGLDFIKLLESYRFIMDSSDALSLPAQGRPQAPETVERMLQSAIYSMQMLESADLQQPAPLPDTRPPADREGEDARDPANGSQPKRQVSRHAPAAFIVDDFVPQKTEESTVIEGQTCLGCKATSTPEWRRGPMGPRTLCNACGLVYAKLIKKRVREGAFGKTNGQGAPSAPGLGDESGLASSGDGASDDEDSYGSQDRRSEIGGA